MYELESADYELCYQSHASRILDLDFRTIHFKSIYTLLAYTLMFPNLIYRNKSFDLIWCSVFASSERTIYTYMYIAPSLSSKHFTQ